MIAIRRAALLFTAALPLLVAGCVQELNTRYGSRQGFGADSVNGTTVLGEMFTAAGCKVTSWRHLSPHLKNKADCVVWFPDDKEPPSEAARDWLDGWLGEKPGRTLVYVLRDYDAGPVYWTKVEPSAPEDQKKEIRWERDVAEARAKSRRLPREEKTLDFGWFSVQTRPEVRRVRFLVGQPEWTDGVDAAQTEIEVGAEIRRRRPVDALLKGDLDPLVARIRRRNREGQILAVANGSFLLNLPLVNHQHRKLAGKLIDEVKTTGAKQVFFLESGPGGPPIRDKDPKDTIPTGLAIFLIWPTNWILWHFAVAGLLYCMARWPIFGVARRLEPEALSDFGRHVQALAEHLKKTRDRGFAQSRVQHWRQMNPDSGGTAGLSSSAALRSASALLDKPAVPPDAVPPVDKKAGVES